MTTAPTGGKSKRSIKVLTAPLLADSLLYQHYQPGDYSIAALAALEKDQQ